MKIKFYLFTVIAVVMSSSVAFAATPDKGVGFSNIQDGAKVTSPVDVKMDVQGMTIEKAGTMTANTGHHHLLIDSNCLPENTVIGAGDSIKHFGLGQTEAKVDLPPGDHTLTLQFADGAHRSYGPEMCKTVHVHVGG